MQMQTIKAQSISEFCRSYGISRGTYYNHEALGTGEVPRAIQIGRRRVIPVSAILEWESRKLGEVA